MVSKNIFASVAAAALLFPVATFASPRTLPFSYPYETMPKGVAELELHVDMSPLRALATSGKSTWVTPSVIQTEFEYGITDRLELGLYVRVVPGVSARFAQVGAISDGNAIKQRLRYRFAEAGQWPVDVSIYGEIVEGEAAVAFEAKVNLARRFGRLLLLANLWGEREYYYDGRADWVANPTGGFSYEVTPWFHPGVEYWMRKEVSNRPNASAFMKQAQQFVGPTCMINFGRFWTSVGVYARVNDVTHTAVPGESPGPMWVRTVIGVELP